MSQHSHADIVIVGAGIIGLLTAWELSKAGHQNILVLDKGEVGHEASRAAAGILSPLGPWRYPESVQELSRQSHQLYPSLCEELHALSGIDPEYEASGLLILLGDDEADQAHAWAQSNTLSHEFLDEAVTASRYPGLACRTQAMWMPEVGQVRSPRLLQALHKALEQRGVEFQLSTAVRKLTLENGRVLGVETPGGKIAAGKVVLAAGAWTPELIPRGVWRPEIQPVKGQMLLYKSPQAMLDTIVLQGSQYLVPRRDGRILAGSTMEQEGFNKSPTLEVKQALRGFAETLMPSLAACEIEAHWTGLRPGSPDNVPTVGAHPEVSGLWLNCGHYRNGIALAPATARDLLRLMS